MDPPAVVLYKPKIRSPACVIGRSGPRVVVVPINRPNTISILLVIHINLFIYEQIMRQIKDALLVVEVVTVFVTRLVTVVGLIKVTSNAMITAARRRIAIAIINARTGVHRQQ